MEDILFVVLFSIGIVCIANGIANIFEGLTMVERYHPQHYRKRSR